MGGSPMAWLRRGNDEALALICAEVDQDAFGDAWEQGGKLTGDEAVALALASLDRLVLKRVLSPEARELAALSAPTYSASGVEGCCDCGAFPATEVCRGRSSCRFPTGRRGTPESQPH
jgi:hypothetical protein